MEPSHRLDRTSRDEARTLLTACCGSARWVERMIARRPFGDDDTLLIAARREWYALSSADWLEAFGHHPEIGDRESLRQRFASTGHLSEREQDGIDGASEEVLAALADGNRAYRERFGYIFIVCATGLKADEMLARLQARLGNTPDAELRIAAGEQAKITAIRLRALG